MIFAGIDVGSISTKAALVKDGKLIAEKMVMTGYRASGAARNVYEAVLSEPGISPSSIAAVAATGYGRNSVDFANRVVTEITCHAAGARYLNPKVRSVIDIGGQDSKVIALSDGGRVTDFVMNDKCAAGTGRFLEVMARALEVDLDDFGAVSLQAEKTASISSLCTVFAESEVISLISSGEKRENIIAGIHDAIVARISAMAARIGLVEPVMMTGGVSRNTGVVRAFEQEIGKPVIVSEKAQIAGAIGAALVAASSASP